MYLEIHQAVASKDTSVNYECEFVIKMARSSQFQVIPEE
jgi:hypothetical protein